MCYVHKNEEWPMFRWNWAELAEQLARVRLSQGRFLGRMASLGFGPREESFVEALTEEVQKSSEIEGERLDRTQVRSSIARRLGIEAGALAKVDRTVDGVVEMMLDATQKFGTPLTAERLFGWHAALFPTGYSGMQPIRIGAWRDDSSGPMQVVSGRIGRQKVHYEAPAALRLDHEMRTFLTWFEDTAASDPLLKAAVAHLWFVTIHPFDDGNGRIARAITEMALSRAEGSAQRFYSMSSQIRKTRKIYYDVLERTQSGGLDVTPWLKWFLNCLGASIKEADSLLDAVSVKSRFWERLQGETINPRQRLMLNKMLDGFQGKLTSSKWAAIADCSQDTALRDILDLVEKSALSKDGAGGRSTSYSLRTD